MAGEDVEVAIERAQVDGNARRRLAAIDQHLGAGGVREPHDALDRQHCAGDIGDVGDRDELGARPDQRREFRHVEPAGGVDRRRHELDADTIAQQLPGHDVGVMLHDGEEHLIAGLQEGRTPAVGDEVDGLGGVPHEDDLARIGGTEEAPHLLARLLIELGRARREAVDAAMHIGVVAAVDTRRRHR